LAVRESGLAPRGSYVTITSADLKASLEQQIEQRQLLGEFISKVMVPGIDGDFGVIPGTKKKTLLKPGAEKLIELFRCRPEYVIEEKIENWDNGLFYYLFRCRIVYRGTDETVAVGFGSSSTRESKHRWRDSKRACPQCGAQAIITGKKEYSGGFICFAKKGGCGAKFTEDDPAITEQKIGRAENEDFADSINTVLKIAKKRALVDAAIALARCSDMFTQDMDDVVTDDALEATPVDGAPNGARTAKGSRRVSEADLEQKIRQATDLDSLKGAWARVIDAWKELGAAAGERLKKIKEARKAELDAKAKAAPPMSANGKLILDKLAEAQNSGDIEAVDGLFTSHKSKLAEGEVLEIEAAFERAEKRIGA